MSPNQGWVEPPNPPPAPGPPPPPPSRSGTIICPKCHGTMRLYNRNGIHIEQCDSCRGIFLDFGELENLVRLEGQVMSQPPPPPPPPGAYGPGWGYHGGHHYRRHGFGSLFFSS